MSVDTFTSTAEDGYGTTAAVNKTYPHMSVGAESSQGQNNDSEEYHVFFYFNTASLPDNATISQVKLYYTVSSTQGNINALKLYVYIGNNTAGSTLETTDYNATINSGTKIGDTVGTTGLKTITSTSSAVIAEINKTGYTNVEIDAYWIGEIDSSGSLSKIYDQSNATEANRPRLEITYTVAGGPPQRMLLGVGL